MKLDKITPEEASSLIDGRVEYRPTFCIATPERTAVAIFAPPIAQHFKVKLPGALELTRLWQANGEFRPLSAFVGAALRWLHKLAPDCPCIFSYADPAQIDPHTHRYHSGGIYQATNFTLLGLARATDKWRTPSGTIWSPQKLYRFTPGFAERFPDATDRHGKRRRGTKSNATIQELHPDWTLIPGEPKILFCYPMRLTVNDVRKIIGGRYKSS